MIVLTGNQAYTLEHEHKNGWNAEMFKERYSEVLERFDYIVGDWGYNQLRLRGFYQEGHPRATKDTVISSVVDYLNEYCNFGCAYFVLRKTEVKSAPAGVPDAEALTVTGEAAAQAAETAAAATAASSNGMLMRWPLKERLGGPVRMPGAAAVARAAAEAERRQLLQTQQQSATGGKSADSRQSSGASAASDYGYGGKPGNRAASGSGAAERRPYGGSHQGGQADSRSGGRPGPGNRGPRPHAHSNLAERFGGSGPSKPGGNWRQQAPDASRTAAEPARASDAGIPTVKSETVKNGSRWPGKNRRKGRFGGKPNRPDTTPRDDGGSGSGRHAGE